MLFLLNIGVSLGMESVNALFPLYVQSLGASILEVGLLLSIAGLFSTIIMLPSGWVSDRFGRKLTLVLSVVLASFPPFLYTYATNWWQIIPWAMIYAASFAVFIPARMVYIADSTSSAARSKIYGYMNLAWPIGTLIGPTVAGLVAEAAGLHYPFYLASVVSLLSLLPALSIVESQSPQRLSPVAERLDEGNAGFSREAIYLLALLSVHHFFVSAGIGTSYSLLSIYLSEIFMVDKLHVGLFFSFVGVSLFGSQLVGGWASSHLGLKKTMVVCFSAIAPLFILCSFAPSYEWFTITYVALYGIYSMTWPASVSILMNFIRRPRWGLATGVRQMGIRLGFTIGPLLGGLVWEAYGAATFFYASAILIALSILFLIPIREG
jgi:DHA1 family multidrug resistance protein-like MFS transporter